jgi:hypothetical protein
MNGQGQLRATLNIRERPAEANDRAVPGHWEGDLLMGKRMHAMATLVERKSRFVMLVALPNGHTADLVADALATKITELPDQLRRSLTWDQGKEMAAHARFTIATDVPVYFCDPRSPWQRGSNENTNGLLRQYSRSVPRSRTTPRPTSTPSPQNSTTGLDKPSAGGHHHKHSTKRCDDPLRPPQIWRGRLARVSSVERDDGSSVLGRPGRARTRVVCAVLKPVTWSGLSG